MRRNVRLLSSKVQYREPSDASPRTDDLHAVGLISPEPSDKHNVTEYFIRSNTLSLSFICDSEAAYTLTSRHDSFCSLRRVNVRYSSFSVFLWRNASARLRSHPLGMAANILSNHYPLELGPHRIPKQNQGVRTEGTNIDRHVRS